MTSLEILAQWRRIAYQSNPDDSYRTECSGCDRTRNGTHNRKATVGMRIPFVAGSRLMQPPVAGLAQNANKNQNTFAVMVRQFAWSVE